MSALFEFLFPPKKIEGKGKNVLITGTDMGLGELTAKILAQRGFTVYAGCFSTEGLTKWSKLGFSNVHAFALDVTKGEDVARCAALIQKECPQGLHCLINNAGIFEGFLVDLASESQMRRTMEVNYFGAVSMIKAHLNLLKKAKGRIVNISSAAGRFSTYSLGLYSASKFALEAISDALRAELSFFGIPVILVEPGFTRTQFVAVLQGKWEADWNNVPSETKQQYGEDFFSSQVTLLDILSRFLSVDADVVVDTIVQAATAVYPKTRYQVGFETRLLIFANNYIPTFLRDWIIRYILKFIGVKPKAMIE